MDDHRAVLLGAGRDEQVWDGDAMMACGREFALSSDRDRERLGVHTQVAEELEVIFEALVVAMRACAIEQFETGDRAQAQLVDVVRLDTAAA